MPISLNKKMYEMNTFHVWPPASNISVGLGYKGTLPTTLAWGTDGLYVGVLVISIRPSRMIEEIKIENGIGLTATQVLINDGDQVEITVEDDRSVTFPDPGATVTLLNPIPAGAGATSETFQVVDASYQGARKQNGQRTLLVKKYTLITPAAM